MRLHTSNLLLLLLPALTIATSPLPDQRKRTSGDFHQISIMDTVLGQAEPDYKPQTTPQPLLSDLLTIEPSASIFYSYAREVERLSLVLGDKNGKVTVFVPTNRAVMALPRKPNEGPVTQDEIEITPEAYDKRAKKFVERWVAAHVVPESPISFTSAPHRTLLDHKSITFKAISGKTPAGPLDWTQVTLEDGVRIISKKDALNGELYLIDGTILTDV